MASEPFLNGTSSNYVEEMYIAWLENPKSVHKVRSSAPHWCGGLQGSTLGGKSWSPTTLLSGIISSIYSEFMSHDVFAF